MSSTNGSSNRRGTSQTKKKRNNTQPQQNELPAENRWVKLEPVAYFNGAMPTGVTVSHHQGRIFVNFPRWGDNVPFTVAEIRDGKEVMVAYPDEAINQTNENDLAAAPVSVDRLLLIHQTDCGFSTQPTQCSGPDQNYRWAETGLRRFNYR